MLSYQVPISAYKRIIKNDKSDQFKIIINIKNTDHNENISIEKHSQIMISTTINKARVISKVIDDMYSMDPSLNRFEFEFNNQNNPKIKIDEIIEIFKLILESVENEVSIPEYKRDTFSLILNTLGDDRANITTDLDVNPNENYYNSDNDNDNTPNEIIFECDFEGDELSGIISCIKQMTSTRTDGNNGIKLSCGGTEDKEHPLVNLITYDKNHINDYFYNFLMPLKYDEGWVEFDFGFRKINVASYTIRTSGSYGYHPKSWQIVGSNDHMNWEIIDQQTDNPTMNGKFIQHRFTCQKTNKFYQFIRYIALDAFVTNVYNNCICLTCIEFFGSIKTPESG